MVPTIIENVHIHTLISIYVHCSLPGRGTVKKTNSDTQTIRIAIKSWKSNLYLAMSTLELQITEGMGRFEGVYMSSWHIVEWNKSSI